MAENVGGIFATAAIDDKELAPTLAKLKASMGEVERELKELHNSFLQAGSSAADVGAKIGELAQKKRELANAITTVSSKLQEQAVATRRLDTNLGQAGGASKQFSYQLGVIGASLDDLQYVGEMGLRPIINNLMMIHPALGIVAIGLDQMRKNGDTYATAIKSISEALLEVVGISVNFAAEGSFFSDYKKEVDNLTHYITTEIPKAWREISGSGDKADDEAIKAFVETTGSEDKKRGKAIADAIATYGGARFLNEMIDPGINNPDVLRQERKSLVDLVAKGAEGNRKAQDEIVARTQGTPVGAQIWAALPETEEWKKKDKKATDAARRKAINEWNEWVGEDNDQDWMRGETPAENKARIKKETDAMRGNVKDFLKADEEERRDDDKREGLNTRLFNLLNQPKEGKSLDIEAYNDSIKSTNDADQLRQLQEINKTLRELKQLEEKQRGVVAIRR